MSLSDELLRMLARRVGVATTWTDWDGSEKTASLDTLRGVLKALGYPSGSDGETRNTLAALDAGVAVAATQTHFATARVGQPVVLPPGFKQRGKLEVEYEDGERQTLTPVEGWEGALTLPALERPGYHRIRGAEEIVVATAPERCFGFRDLSGGKAGWGLAAQIYSLSAGTECGVGDFGGVAEMAQASARRGADFLAISPCHAQLGVPERHDSPYSPSSRQFFDPLYADLRLALDADLARAAATAAGIGGAAAGDRVDWQAARAAKMKLLDAAYDALMASHSRLRDEFARFCDTASPALRRHALFEAIREAQAPEWDWRNWPAEYRSPEAEGAKLFAAERGEAVARQVFLQWVTERSLAGAHEAGKREGMRVGLIADIAAGLDPAGSDAWARPDALLQGLTMGAPPDPYTPPGQDWKLTTFSPQGLAATGYQTFIDMHRACLAQVGGLRLDHAMGMQRLWLIPEGMGPKDGTYVAYPNETLFRLVALESWRRRAVVIGEDLGTFPAGFREYLEQQGVSGMRLLRIQRDKRGWLPPDKWTPSAAALTVTHDIMPTSGWWKGAEIEDDEEARQTREQERELIWKAFREARVAEGDPPPPDQAGKVVDAAFGFVAATPCQIKLLALEDALAVDLQPNVPGTTTEKPNWRHRFAESAEGLLSRPGVAERLGRLGPSRGSV